MSRYDQIFSLDLFTGPLHLLLQLIRSQELHIRDIPIKAITGQCLKKLQELLVDPVEYGAEFIGATSLLLWLKSKMLLPKDLITTEERDELEACLSMLEKVAEYCAYKEAASHLMALEEAEQQRYLRAPEPIASLPKAPGIECLSLERLAELFKEVMERGSLVPRTIYEESWRVSDKIAYIGELVGKGHFVPLHQLFKPNSCRAERIVTFLAMLELMKSGELAFACKEACDGLIPGEAYASESVL